jgi:uncharacterized protein (TIGR03790 family)
MDTVYIIVGLIMLRVVFRFVRDNLIHVSHIFIILIILLSSVSSFTVLATEQSFEHSEQAEELKININPPLQIAEVVSEPNQINQVSTISRSQRPIEYNYTDVLIVYNGNSGLSVRIAKYFQNARSIPEINMLNLTNITAVETVSKTVFGDIRTQVENHLDDNNLTDSINYIVTTKGVPLRVSGGTNDRACLDNELALIKGTYSGYIGNSGWLVNPYFEDEVPFTKTKYDFYLVTRLTGFTWPEIKRLIDKATLSNHNRGTYVLDVDASKGFTGGYGAGNVWIRDANNILIAKGEITDYDDTNTFISGKSNVMGYASWGSNDASDTSNYVSNYGFEASTNDFPNNWFGIYDPGIVNNISTNSSDSYSGSYSVRINRSTQSVNYTAVAQNITITPNVRYYLRGRVNISSIGGTGSAHMQIQALDASNNILNIINSNFRSSVTSSWVSFSQRIYEPVAGAVKVRILAVLNQTSGEVFFDHITFNDILPHHNWLPGAIAETFVSTGGRSFTYGTSYGQSLIADLIRDGVTGVKGYVYEPYLSAIAHPDILFDRYTYGYNLAESYYMASNFLGWMDVVVGDPKLAPYSDVLPDLNILIDSVNVTPIMSNEGEEIELQFLVSNIGNGSAEMVDVILYQISSGDETEVFNSAVPILLGGGGTMDYDYKYTPDATGEVILKIVIDPNNEFKELYEDNNIVEKRIYINNPPTPNEISIYNDKVYRTAHFEAHVAGSDIESSASDLIPILEARLDDGGEWFVFTDEQTVRIFNASSNYWEFKITTNVSMELGDYSFRVAFVDQNYAKGSHYYLHKALEVLNNPPVMNNITVDRTMINRTESVKVTVSALDVEHKPIDLAVRIQYRTPPLDITSEKGWVDVDYVLYDEISETRWCQIHFKSSFDTGDYQIRGQVSDKDGNVSEWLYYDNVVKVLNNQPKITNFTISNPSVYRTESIILQVFGFDIEEFESLATVACEVSYQVPQENPENAPIWENEFLSDIEFISPLGPWYTEFTPLAIAQTGNYSFRARLMDVDGNWSEVVFISEIVVLNNPPTASTSSVPESAFEDYRYSFSAKGSKDIEDSIYNLAYYWEITSSVTKKIVNHNKSFQHDFNTSGEYKIILKVTDTDGDFAYNNRTITIENKPPRAEFEILPRRPQAGETVTFDAKRSTDSNSDLPTLEYKWDFGDHTPFGYGKNENHSYSFPGEYTIILTVTDDDSEFSVYEKEILIYPKDTPTKGSGSGVNDISFYAFLGIGSIIIIVILILLFLFIKRKSKEKDIDRTLETTITTPPPEDQPSPDLPPEVQPQQMIEQATEYPAQEPLTYSPDISGTLPLDDITPKSLTTQESTGITTPQPKPQLPPVTTSVQAPLPELETTKNEEIDEEQPVTHQETALEEVPESEKESDTSEMAERNESINDNQITTNDDSQDVEDKAQSENNDQE